MNKIEGLLDTSDYQDYWDFINYKIDGLWLDEKLEELYPNNGYKGLIPTLVYWMERNDEKEVVWNRILPNENETSICPILMCPDDNDFSCTLIVAEIRNCGKEVQWQRIGLNKTQEWEAKKVGSVVEWFHEFKELKYSITDYIKMLESFRNRLPIDKLKIENQIRNLT
jgi:hypothetical protein